VNAVKYWLPERQPGRRSCEECRTSEDKQVLEGHDECLPPIGGRYTADNVPVTEGLRVWDYDLRPGTVTEVDHSFQGTPDGPLGIVAWHIVVSDEGGSGMFDGSRMCTTHPSTGEPPPPVDVREPCIHPGVFALGPVPGTEHCWTCNTDVPREQL